MGTPIRLRVEFRCDLDIEEMTQLFIDYMTSHSSIDETAMWFIEDVNEQPQRYFIEGQVDFFSWSCCSKFINDDAFVMDLHDLWTSLFQAVDKRGYYLDKIVILSELPDDGRAKLYFVMRSDKPDHSKILKVENASPFHCDEWQPKDKDYTELYTELHESLYAKFHRKEKDMGI